MRAAHHDPSAHYADPQQQACPGKERARERQRLGQEAIGVDERDLPRENTEQTALPVTLGVFLMAPEHFRSVRWNVAQQDIGRMQLAQELNDFVLRDGIVAELCQRIFPDLLHRSLAVHLADDQIGGRREAMKALRGEVLQDIPGVTAVFVPVDLRMLAQARRELAHAVPGWAEERLGHRGDLEAVRGGAPQRVRAATSKAAGVASRWPDASRSRRSGAARCRSCPPLPCRAASADRCARAWLPRGRNSCPHARWRPA